MLDDRKCKPVRILVKDGKPTAELLRLMEKHGCDSVTETLRAIGLRTEPASPPRSRREL